jgi:hypothetical protein
VTFHSNSGGVACAQVAKTPNRKSDCVNRPAEGFGSRHAQAAAVFNRLLEFMTAAPLRTRDSVIEGGRLCDPSNEVDAP